MSDPSGSERVLLRLAGKLVRLFPGAFRREYAREVMETLRQRTSEVGRQSFPRRMLFWIREYRALLSLALRMRFNPPEDFNRPRQGRVRRYTRWNMLKNLPLDFRRTVRGLARRPAFAAVAILTLALGIGANTAIFSLIDQVMLRSLPYPDAERLMLTYFYDLDDPQITSQATPADYLDWREQVGASAQMAAYYPGRRDLYAEGGEPESIQTVLALGDLLGVLGVPPAHGRAWLPDEGVQVAVPSTAGEPDGRPGVVVLSDSLSRRLFGHPQAALQQEVRLSGRPYTVIGVMPPGFRYPWPDVEAWLPVQLTPEAAANRTEYLFRALIRLPRKEGVRERLQAELDALAARLRQEHPVSNSGRGIRLIPLQERMVVGVRDSLVTLWLAVGLVLLVACVNLANLMLVRNMGRGREMAVRKALGAGRLQTLWQSLLESLTISLAGGAAGAVLAWLTLDALKSLAPEGMPRLEQAAIDQRVLLFSLGLSLAAGVFFGILPALRMSRQDPASALQKGSRGASGGRSASRFQRGLVAVEVALSVVLLIAAGLTLRSFIQVIQQDPGYDPEGLLAVSIYAPDYRYPEPAQVLGYFDRVVEGAGALPGVESASYSSVLPLSEGGNSAWIHVREKPIPQGQSPDFVHYRIIGPDLFRTLKIPLRRGRVFEDSDRAGSSPTALINEAFVDRYLNQDDDPLSLHLTIGPKGMLPWMRIVGVVGNVRNNGLAQPPGPAVFLLRSQLDLPWRSAELIVRAAPGTRDSTAAQVRDLLHQIDPQIPAYRIRDVEQDIAQSEGLRRSVVQLLGGFALLALILAGVGLFGVVSFTVGRRVPEIGIRMALGAAPSRIGGWVLRNGLVPVVIGLVLGLAASFPLTDLLSNQLYGVRPGDPMTLSAVALGLLLVAALACWQPARRATRTDPVRALRAE
ncbi:MAG TPA: ABC transporter permease [Acidobacteriota bacterium]|nr:ABC transporter permease [Acidobacteriota bacterium]